MDLINRKSALLTFLLLLHFQRTFAVAPYPESVSPRQERAVDSSSQEVSLAEIRRLVEQLDANRFADREAAEKHLEAIGQAAIGPLVVAAPRGSLELQQRAMQVLESFYCSADEALCDAATVALRQMAGHTRPNIARRAAEILQSPPYGLQPGNWLGKGLVHGLGGARPLKLGGAGGIVIGGGEVRLGAGAQIVVSAIEGDLRFVDIIQGSGLGVFIIENKKTGAIEVFTCQQQPTGPAKYKRYQAATAEQLRRDHQKIHGFFEKFKGYRGGMVMNGAVPIQ